MLEGTFVIPRHDAIVLVNELHEFALNRLLNSGDDVELLTSLFGIHWGCHLYLLFVPKNLVIESS